MAEALAYEAPPRREGKDPTALTRTLVIWLGLGVAASLGAVATSAQEIWMYSSLDPSTPMTAWSDTPSGGPLVDALVMIASLFQMLVGVVAAFLSLKWIYRAALNSRALARGVTVTPRWAIGWYFVPIANLWKPFRAMKEAWATGTRPEAWNTVETPGLMRWWWGLWLVNNMTGNASFRLWLRARDVGDLTGSAAMTIVSELVNVPLTLVFIVLVRRIAVLQQTALQQRVFD